MSIETTSTLIKISLNKNNAKELVNEFKKHVKNKISYDACNENIDCAIYRFFRDLEREIDERLR